MKEFAFGSTSPIVDVIDRRRQRRHSSRRRISPSAITPTNSARSRDCSDTRTRSSQRTGATTLTRSNRRANNIVVAFDLRGDAPVASFAKLMPEPMPGETAESIGNDALRAEIKTLLESYEGATGLKQKTITALDDVRDFAERGKIEDQPWQRWARLTKHDVAVPDKPRFAPADDGGDGLRAPTSHVRPGQALHERRLLRAAESMRAPMRSTSGIGGSSISSIRTVWRWSFSAIPILDSS